jgi:uncharacterized tellurite resistance protein B-like protein
MFLLDQIRQAPAPVHDSMDAAEAFAAIALIAVASDGDLADEELHTLINTLSRMQLFKTDRDRVTPLIQNLLNLLKHKGIGTVFNIAKAGLPYDLRESVFAVATDLVLADGKVAEREQILLDQLYRALDIHHQTATKIVEVIVIKNQG